MSILQDFHCKRIDNKINGMKGIGVGELLLGNSFVPGICPSALGTLFGGMALLWFCTKSKSQIYTLPVILHKPPLINSWAGVKDPWVDSLRNMKLNCLVHNCS